MIIKIKKLNPEAKTPIYGHPGDAGMDFFSSKDYLISSGGHVLVETGISMAIPTGYVGLLWDKSGLANKNGLSVLGGVIDCGYRGEIKIVLQNNGDSKYLVSKGQKVAQMLIQPVISPTLELTDSLEENTSRGDGGFGSTGLE